MDNIVKPEVALTLETCLGQRLRDQRKRLGLTQDGLAARLGVTDRSIRAYESGNSSIPSDTLFKMMAIGIDIVELFYGPADGTINKVTTDIDRKALDRAVAWVDGEWGKDEEGGSLSERERLEWILVAYLSQTENSVVPAGSDLTATAPKTHKRSA